MRARARAPLWHMAHDVVIKVTLPPQAFFRSGSRLSGAGERLRGNSTGGKEREGACQSHCNKRRYSRLDRYLRAFSIDG